LKLLEFPRSARSDALLAPTTMPRYLAMLFTAVFTLPGAYLAAFLKPLMAALASDFDGFELAPVSPIFDTALQNFALADGTEALAGPARTASADAASAAASKI